MIPFYESQIAKIRILRRENLEFPIHLHNAIEIVYVSKGVLNFTIDDKNCDLVENSLAILYPNIVHGYFTSPENTSEVLLVCCEAELLPDYSDYLFRHVPQKPIVSLNDVHPDVLFALKRLEEERHSSLDFSLPKIFLQLIIGHLIPHLELTPLQVETAPNFVQALLSYIALHFREPLSLEHLAKNLSTNKYHISRTFSKKLHISYNEYINRIRLDYAAKLIRTTNQTMTYICLESGFENQHTFNRVFKQHYGITPNEFRHK